MEIKNKVIGVIRDKRTQLPTLPVVIEKILGAAGDDRTSAKDLAGFISKDQAISSKILRLANSAYYGLMREVDSIPRAITIIGFNEIVGLIIGMNVFSSFRQKSLHEIFTMRDLWLHSIGCASIAKEIAQKAGENETERVFMIGLLHDMGQVILAEYFPEDYKPVLEEAMESEVLLYRKENEILGIDHASLSGILMERWHFPDHFVLPSRFHHNSLECPLDYQRHAMVVELADSLCHKAQIGHSGNWVVPELEGFEERLGIEPDDMEAIIEEMEEQRAKIEQFFMMVN